MLRLTLRLRSTKPSAENRIFLIALGALLLCAVPTIRAQELSYLKGQTISTAYEGWIEKEDGSKAFLFGYFNRNWEETPDIPIGEANFFSPGPEDQGQPTRFLPRRNRYVFEIPVPDNFSEGDDLVWSLEAGGEVSKAFASLRPDYFLDNVTIMSETGALGGGFSTPEIRANTPPEVELEGLTERVQTRVGEPVILSVFVTDDGQPISLRGFSSSRRNQPKYPIADDGSLILEEAMKRPTQGTVGKQNGLHHSWFFYRGPEGGDVTFDPPQTVVWEDVRPWTNSPWSNFWEPPELPDDNRWVTHATFNKAGTYVLRGRADDGGLWSDIDVVVEVSPIDR